MVTVGNDSVTLIHVYIALTCEHREVVSLRVSEDSETII